MINLRTALDWFRRDYHAFYTVLILFMAVVLIGDIINNRFHQPDFCAFLQGAQRFVNAENIYVMEPGEISKNWFKYSPAAATFFTPFLLLPVSVAKVIFYILVCAMVIWFFTISRRLVTQLSDGRIVSSQIHFFVAFLALGEIIYREIGLGNINAPLALATMSASLWAIDRKDWAAGALLGLITLFKPNYALFLIYFLCFGRWKMILSFGAVWIIGFIPPAMIYGASNAIALYREWFSVMRLHNASGSWIGDNYGMNNIFEVLAWPFKWLKAESFLENPVYPLLVLGVLAAGFWLLRRKCKAAQLPTHVTLLYLIACSPLLFQVDLNQFIILLPVILFLLGLWRTQALLWRVALVLGLVLLGGNLYEIVGRETHKMLYAAGVYGIGATLLLTMLIFARTNAFSAILTEQQNLLHRKSN